MPELPEVETVRTGLAPFVENERIVHVEVFHARAIRRHVLGASDFSAQLRGRTMLLPGRRGKYMWVPLDDGRALIAHLGMSGQFKVSASSAADDRHLRVRITLASGQRIEFIDQRTFGGLFIDEMDASGLPTSIAHIARDPFDPEYDVDETARRLRKRQQQVKRALLDQTLVSGIGNIYADEALWRAQLHFGRASERLTNAQAVKVLSEARTVMEAALVQGGTSFDEMYVNVNGESGYFERSLEVYGREGQPCSRCGRAIRRVAFANRSSYFCTRCQPPPRRAAGSAHSP